MMSNKHEYVSILNTQMTEPSAKPNGFSISNSLKGMFAIRENKGNRLWSQLIIVEPGSSADLRRSLKRS